MGFESFIKSLEYDDVVESIRAGLIGEGMCITTPFGEKRLTYADYTASGRALRQVEDFVAEQVLPLYANSHTESSFCGAYTTKMRESARRIVAKECNVEEDCSVIFSGSGATSAVNRLVSLSGVAHLDNHNGRPVVFIGPYEHHSNILPWRESGAEIIEIDEASSGGPDLIVLENELKRCANRPLLIGTFSAASNVSGIITNADAVTRLLKQYGAFAFWDYAGGGPYLPINMNPGKGLEKDAIFISPHKFPGGPGASGILIIRNSIVKTAQPTWPGGGSVSYVSPWAHDYLESIVEREEAGTPNIIGDIRVALVFLIKSAIGTEYIKKRDKQLCKRAESIWCRNPNIEILGADKKNRLPIYSFIIKNAQGDHIHHQLFTRMLSDVFGVQARGGCVCAGPYGHRLLEVKRETSENIRSVIQQGKEIYKPGWIRLNLSYLMDDETADRIIQSVDELARDPTEYLQHYAGDEYTSQFLYHEDI